MVPDEKKELEEPHNYFISELICLKLFHGDKSERVSICMWFRNNTLASINVRPNNLNDILSTYWFL